MIDLTSLQQTLASMPAALRRLLDAEIAAGNRVVAVGHSHPAPPIGAWLQLARALSTRPPQAADGLVHRVRNNSMYAGDITDAGACYFLLEPPLPPPAEADMDAIRAAANAPRPKPVREINGSTPFLVDLDHRGESLTYREQDRKADMQCSISSKAILATGTLSDWWYPAAVRWQVMTADERRLVIERIVDYCRREQGLARVELED